jgi:hypothetical protein
VLFLAVFTKTTAKTDTIDKLIGETSPLSLANECEGVQQQLEIWNFSNKLIYLQTISPECLHKACPI